VTSLVKNRNWYIITELKFSCVLNYPLKPNFLKVQKGKDKRNNCLKNSPKSLRTNIIKRTDLIY